MPMEYLFCIRKAQNTPEDIKAVRHVMSDAFKKYMSDTGLDAIPGFTIEALKEKDEDIVKDIVTNSVYIAFIDGVAVGSLRLEINREESYGYISRFGVCSGSRHMGVGTSFMAMVDKILKAENIRQCRLYTASKYTTLVRFYYGCGFYIKSTSEDKGYVRALMVKDYND